jgi:hypothetical protein
MPPAPLFLEGEIGWGGRIRTYTIRINSAVSYRLDHAPADLKRSVESLRVRAFLLTPQARRAAHLKKIIVRRKTRKPGTKKNYHGFSVEYPASVQARHPPSIEMQLV